MTILFLLLATGWQAAVAQSPVAEPNSKPASGSNAVQLNSEILTGFIEKHCTRCHGPEEQNGETRLDTLTLQIANSDTALHWQEVLDVLNLGKMPPEDEPTPSAEELARVLAHLTDALTESKKRLSESGGDVALRRINRREYRNTIDHLFGLRVPDELLPPDDIADGYDTVGQDQQFSTYHFEDYLAAGKTIAEVALKWVDAPRQESELRIFEPESRNDGLQRYIDDYDKKMARIKAGATFAEMGFDDQRQLDLFVKRYDVRPGLRKRYLDRPYTDRGVYLVEGGLYRFGALPATLLDPRATYRYRAIAGLDENAPPLRHFLSGHMDGRDIAYFRVEGTPESPVTLEIRDQPLLTESRVGFKIEESKGAIDIDQYVKLLGGDKEKKSAIWVERMEGEGPFYSDEPAIFETIYQEYFGSSPKREEDKTEVDREEEDLAAPGFLAAFMQTAFRGVEPSPDFVDRLQVIYELHRSHGRSLKEALETPLAMILSSPSYLYLMEEAPNDDEERNIREEEFAHRLSFFLWSRPADKPLLVAARKGTLSDPHVLREQVDRMLIQPHSWALSEGFFTQWADLERFDNIAIDETVHIGFNDGIRWSARQEVQHFFDTMIKENLSLTQLIDSDFVMANDLLAFHYGLDVPNSYGSTFQKVSLPESSPRGGLLGMTAFLTMGSNGERSSPVIRGALVMEKFLHRQPSPPPPNVPELALASDEPLAVLETIKLHRQKAQCASCHKSFDPLGFGLENFDLLGQWRDHETIGDIGKKAGSGKGKRIPIRAEGEFPDQNQPFTNLEEFRSGLMKRKHFLTRSIAEGLLSYGLGRHIEFADQQAIDEICEAAIRNDERIGDLIFAIVSHPVFRRGDQP
ncbi:MAG: DUF1592 domain-containing protein [Planctomycetaceae bacterium]|nr:DUF1592 domain-containing protein [Planctomycetaceae bacterium]